MTLSTAKTQALKAFCDTPSCLGFRSFPGESRREIFEVESFSDEAAMFSKTEVKDNSCPYCGYGVFWSRNYRLVFREVIR